MPRASRDRRRAPRKPERRAPAAEIAAGGERGPHRLVAGGLASVALGVPLAVLPNAAGPYDDPKVWALSGLAALTGLAWLASARRRPADAPDRPGRAACALVLACVAWGVITTVTSVAPPLSVLGNFGRGMGLLTIVSATFLFFVVRSEYRTSRAVRSLVDVSLLGSVPVCLLALAQVVRWDPLPQGWDPAVRGLTIRSTFGTHVFLGSYLVVLIPLAAARLEWAWRARLPGGRWPAATRAQWLRSLAGAAWASGAVALIGLAAHWGIAWWALAPWGIAGAALWVLHIDRGEPATDTALTTTLLAGLLVAQALVVVLSRGRGAFIAMLVGLSVTVLGFLVRHRAWKTVAVAVVGLIALVTFLVLLNRPGSPVAGLGQTQLLARLSQITNVNRGSPGWVRLQVWSGIADGWRRQLRGEPVFPGLSPRVRSLVGYGPETQLLVLEALTASSLGALPTTGQGWKARYVFDRAHNVTLDHLVTGGLVGAGLWIVLLGGIVVVGAVRMRTGVGAEDVTIRLGTLGAILAFAADGQVGVATPMPLALFWVCGALLTSAPRPESIAASSVVPAPPRLTGSWRVAGLAAATLAVVLVAAVDTRWLLASVAYAEGTRHAIAGRMADAHAEFRRSVALVPWLPLPAEGAASALLRLAGGEADPSRRLELLHEADALLVQARHYALGGPESWALTAQIAFAEARAGERGQIAASRSAYAAALALRPGDPRLLAQSAWASLEAGDMGQARETAERALAQDPSEWLAWAILARSSRALGDPAEAERAAGKARELAPPTAHRRLEGLGP